MDPKPSNSHEAQPFELKTLPLEIRELIWEFSLPERRVFQVSRISRQQSVTDAAKREHYFIFNIRRAPPVASRVCSESRSTALRKGFFFSPHREHPGHWFNPDKDILYLDRNQRTSFHVKPGQPRMLIPGWDRVLNVGLDWRAFFRDIPRPSGDETIGSCWKAAIDPLYAYMPRMKTVNYILPKARYKGGVTWGREPYGAQNLEAELVPLPEDTQIPWETSRNLGRGAPQAQLLGQIQGQVQGQGQGQAQGRIQLAPSLVTWGEVKRDIESGFSEAEEADDGEGSAREGESSAGRSSYPPQIIGWLLLRVGASIEQENPLFITA
ncbi:hypothetical protein AK830_g3819 [Neonectria ditissima]|uniref:2EXR domain-containing protein n=1 Tax=Neonectria ditissima TaxID=78410 RepID=A0A0P7BPC7_9HYPO|nr:hypothetical protein AK830_g3819 [Neonectria ditissima]